MPHVKIILDDFRKDGIKPTLRTIFYRLTPKIIDNLQHDYIYLSQKTAEYRKRSIILGRYLKDNPDISQDNRGVYIVKKGITLADKVFKILDSHQLLRVYKKNRFEKNPIILYHYYGDNEEKRQKYVLDWSRTLPIDVFADETRGEYDNFIDEYKTPEEHIKEKVDFISTLPTEYKKLIPKWHSKKYHVELWTEKNSMVSTFVSMLKDWDVRVVYNRGFDSMAHAYRTYLRIKKAWEEQGKKVRILYCGDLDPSGDAMDEIIDDFMNVCFDVAEYKKIGDYSFERIGVLFEHIDKFNLPKNPDKDVLAKLQEDPRRFQFMDKYGLYGNGHYHGDGCSEIDKKKNGHYNEDKLFQIEIDSLAAEAPLELKKMLIDRIKTYYDVPTHVNLLHGVRHSEDEISLQVIKFVQPLLDEFNMKSMWKWLNTLG